MTSDVTNLIFQARSNECEALDSLLAIFRNYLRVTAQVWLPDGLPGKIDASDLVQETMLKAHQRFGQFKGTTEAELTIWLRRILSHCLVDTLRYYRAGGRDISREQLFATPRDGSGDAFANLIAASGTSPSAVAERREAAVLLADALSQMPAHYRQVILLRNLKDKPWKDVATDMRREIGTVRALWIRALNDLRERMVTLS